MDRPVSGSECAYYLCTKNSRNTPGLRKFSFPVNDAARLEKWILNSGNINLLSLSPKSLRRKFICSEHFSKNNFLSRNLTQDAVPISYLSVPSTSSQRSEVSSESSLPTTSKEVHYLTPEVSPSNSGSTTDMHVEHSILEAIDNIPIIPKRKRQECDNVTRKRRKLLMTPRPISSLRPFARTLTHMQLYHIPKSPWSSKEKVVGLSIYYKSPSTYKYLRRMGVILPSKSSISLWLKSCRFQPGINKNLLKFLKVKVDSMKVMDKECVLLMDEMAIKQCLEFSKAKDIIEGYEDLGELGRREVLAKQALVIMVRGLYSTWKIPVSFYFSNAGVKGHQLKEILFNNLKELKQIGLKPLAVICDQGSSNQKLFKDLGATSEKPYFYIDKTKYFTIFDAPHLIKSVRNNLLDGNFVGPMGMISFSDIRKTYELDLRSKTGRALPKLTDIHMQPNAFQKMNVKLAVQVLSHSMYSAIKTCIKTKQLQSETALNTANFIKKMDRSFDALNSQRLRSKKKWNCALSPHSIEAFEALDDAFHLMENLKKMQKNGSLSRPPCFEGFQLMITAVKMLFTDQKEKGYSFLLTSRLNQDVLENQFSIYRQRGGYSRNPTVRTFQAAFKANCVMNLMKPPKTSNYEEASSSDIADELPYFPLIDEENFTSSDSDASSAESQSSDSPKEASLETNAVKYFSGYLAKKCSEKFKCVKCCSSLVDSEEIALTSDSFLFFKTYNLQAPASLNKPTEIFNEITSKAMKLFIKFHENNKICRRVSLKMFRLIKKKILKYFPSWFNECELHREFILKLLIRVLLYKYCGTISASVKPITKKNEKITIVVSK